MSSYRFPAGVKLLGKCGSKFTMAVTMPTAEGGFFGGACPSCRRHLPDRVRRLWALPDEQKQWCVNCGRASTTAIGSRSDSRCDLPKGDQT